MESELKLYRSVRDILWFSFGPDAGWVMFPPEVGGWYKRQAASGVDPTDMREVPLRMAFNTGIPGAPMSSGLIHMPKCKTNLTSVSTAQQRQDHGISFTRSFRIPVLIVPTTAPHSLQRRIVLPVSGEGVGTMQPQQSTPALSCGMIGKSSRRLMSEW